MILCITTTKALVAEVLKPLMLNNVSISTGASMSHLMRTCFNIHLKEEIPHSTDNVFIIAKNVSSTVLVNVMGSLGQLTGAITSTYEKPSNIVPADLIVANSTIPSPDGIVANAPKGLSPREEPVLATPDRSFTHSNTTNSSMPHDETEETVVKSDDDPAVDSSEERDKEDDEQEEEEYLYMPNDEDEAYKMMIDELERRYAVNGELFVGENYACKKCHLVMGGVDKRESAIERQLFYIKQHVLDEHFTFKRYRCGLCITHGFAWKNHMFLCKHVETAHTDSSCEIMDYWNTVADIELEKMCLECFPHLFSKGSYKRLSAEQERPRVVASEEEARVIRWPPFVDGVGIENGYEVEEEEQDEKSIANSVSLDMSLSTTAAVTPSPTKNEANDVALSSGSSSSKGKKPAASRSVVNLTTGRTSLNSKKCGLCGRLIRCDRKQQRNHIMALHYEKKRYTCNFCDYTATDRKYVRGHSKNEHKGMNPEICFTDHWDQAMEADLEELIKEYFYGEDNAQTTSVNKPIIRLSDPRFNLKNPAMRVLPKLIPRSAKSMLKPEMKKQAKPLQAEIKQEAVENMTDDGSSQDSVRRTARVLKPKKKYSDEPTPGEKKDGRGRKPMDPTLKAIRKDYVCKLCDRVINMPEWESLRRAAMLGHVRVVHLEKPFGCHFCAYACYNAQNVIVHMSKRHLAFDLLPKDLTELDQKDIANAKASECFGNDFTAPKAYNRSGRFSPGSVLVAHSHQLRVKLPIKPRQRVRRSGSNAETNGKLAVKQTEHKCDGEEEENENMEPDDDYEESDEEKAPRKRRLASFSSDEDDEPPAAEIVPVKKARGRPTLKKNMTAALQREEEEKNVVREVNDDLADEDYNPTKDS